MAENLQRMLRQLGGQSVVVDGVGVMALVDTAGVDVGDGVVVDTSLQVAACDVPAVPDGAVVSIGAVAYKVRQVLPVPPDGALQRLVLVRGSAMLAARQVVLGIAQRLIDADTAAGDNVNHTNRGLTFAVYPGLKVYATDDDHQAAEDDITWPHEQLHELSVTVDCVVQDHADLEGAMDGLVEDVLVALEGSAAAAQLSPLTGVRLRSLGSTRSVRADGERATGTASVRFIATYSTNADDPATML